MTGYRKIVGQREWNEASASDSAIPTTDFFDGEQVPVKAYCHSLGAGQFKRHTSQTSGVATVANQVIVLGEENGFFDPLALKRARFTGNWEVVILYSRGGL